jgi:iron complex outermembrane receptor protein
MVLLACAMALPVAAQMRVASLPADLTELSLEDLLKLEVTSVSKHAEPMNRAAAAIYVLTGDEIARAGVRSIAEALRLVPGLQVARTNANTYKISARGFDSSGDKLQVLVDGRSVYTPLTSAVFWDVLDSFLPDIDRIEVIRGPGATLWGANAVNGVINIITKAAADTTGGRLVAGGGTEERAFAGLRSGTSVGDVGAVRFYAKGFERDNAKLTNGNEAEDGERQFTSGARSDWTLSPQQQLSVAGDVYQAREHTMTVTPPAHPSENELSGGNLNGRWSWRPNDTGTVSAQLSYDRYHRFLPDVFDETRDTVDLGAQHDLWLGARNEFTYGFGYRNSHDRTGAPPLLIVFDPNSRTLQTWSAFLQDQFHFLDDAAVWTLGSKFEHNDVSGFEVQPGTRVGWQFAPQWFSWAAVSRAVRTPNRLDQDLAIYCPPPNGFAGYCGPNTFFQIGSHGFDSEKLIAWEWGLRWSDAHSWSADLSTFYNDYRDLRSSEGSGLNLHFANHLSGHGGGGEASVTWKPDARVDVRAWYAFLDLNVDADASSLDTTTGPNTEGSSARHKAGLRVAWQPAADWSTEGVLRYVGSLHRTATPTPVSGDTSVPAYAELDLRLAWRPWSRLELALVGNNLLHDRHPEFGAENTRSELERAGLVEASFEW